MHMRDTRERDTHRHIYVQWVVLRTVHEIPHEMLTEMRELELIGVVGHEVSGSSVGRERQRQTETRRDTQRHAETRT